ncbi:hypothetical protein Tter_2858 [Thermobaculum terrenum ATCC BAA-798]|uniref:Uncharacterized protein n=1 Tax=Thermobaculum terrenum (strain ATCC BAA-798 / CCMEE 7001 / YNP1) TaxID=525904 RepID=D1CJ20_THET1|nr:hypothetical protein Tter_2858 [Thermobaculum terrenum ATCC BAA-798]
MAALCLGTKGSQSELGGTTKILGASEAQALRNGSPRGLEVASA